MPTLLGPEPCRSEFPLPGCDCMTWHADTSRPGDVRRPKHMIPYLIKHGACGYVRFTSSRSKVDNQMRAPSRC